MNIHQNDFKLFSFTKVTKGLDILRQVIVQNIFTDSFSVASCIYLSDEVLSTTTQSWQLTMPELSLDEMDGKQENSLVESRFRSTSLVETSHFRRHCTSGLRNIEVYIILSLIIWFSALHTNVTATASGFLMSTQFENSIWGFSLDCIMIHSIQIQSLKVSWYIQCTYPKW